MPSLLVRKPEDATPVRSVTKPIVIVLLVFGAGLELMPELPDELHAARAVQSATSRTANPESLRRIGEPPPLSAGRFSAAAGQDRTDDSWVRRRWPRRAADGLADALEALERTSASAGNVIIRAAARRIGMAELDRLMGPPTGDARAIRTCGF